MLEFSVLLIVLLSVFDASKLLLVFPASLLLLSLEESVLLLSPGFGTSVFAPSDGVGSGVGSGSGAGSGVGAGFCSLSVELLFDSEYECQGLSESGSVGSQFL